LSLPCRDNFCGNGGGVGVAQTLTESINGRGRGFTVDDSSMIKLYKCSMACAFVAVVFLKSSK
jgi:hypothetical protein